MHSPCSVPFLKSTQRVIKLPKEDPVVFENFFDWIYLSKPQVDFRKGIFVYFSALSLACQPPALLLLPPRRQLIDQQELHPHNLHV